MSVSSQENNEPTVIAESTDTSLDCSPGNKTGETIIAPAFQTMWSLPRLRRKKILRVSRQLVQGNYNLDKRLNVALDRLLDNLVA